MKIVVRVNYYLLCVAVMSVALYSVSNDAFAQFTLFPTDEVLPTYLVRIVPGAADKNNTLHYYPPNISIPTGTTVAWFNDDPSQPHTVTSGIPGSPDSGKLFNSGLIPFTSFMQYTFDEPGSFFLLLSNSSMEKRFSVR